MLADLMSDMEEGDGNGLLDSLTALSDVAEKKDADTQKGEAAWQDRGMRVVIPERAPEGRVKMVEKAARRVAGAAKVQLRRLFLEARRAETFHGVRKGQGLSTRRLVPSALEMRHGMRPTRPDYTTTKRPDVTLAAAIMTDESGSMRGALQKNAAIAQMALSEALDSLKVPTFIGGFEGGTVDVFKDWHQSHLEAKGRVAQVRAAGGTPTADGIQMGLRALSERDERVRVLFVITDGHPNSRDLPVIAHQLRLAKENGVAIVGVGIGSGTYAVKTVFPDHHVCVNKVKDLPDALMNTLRALVFPSKARRFKVA